VCRVAVAGVHHVFHVQRVTVGVNQLMRAEELQRFAALLAFVDHGFIADIRGRFLLTRQTARSCSSRHSQRICHNLRYHQSAHSIRASDPGSVHRAPAYGGAFCGVTAQSRRDDIKAHGLCGHPFPCLADFFWFNIIADKQITAGRIQTHAHVCRNQGGKALDLILIHFRQYQQPSSPSWLAMNRKEADT
jgi:hypothetical protein